MKAFKIIIVLVYTCTIISLGYYIGSFIWPFFAWLTKGYVWIAPAFFCGLSCFVLIFHLAITHYFHYSPKWAFVVWTPILFANIMSLLDIIGRYGNERYWDAVILSQQRLCNKWGRPLTNRHSKYIFGYKDDFILINNYFFDPEENKRDSTTGVLTSKGEEILHPCQYEFREDWEGTNLIYIEDRYTDKKCGLLDKELKTLLPCKFDNIGRRKDLIVASMSDNDNIFQGFYNLTGQEIVPCDYYCNHLYETPHGLIGHFQELKKKGYDDSSSKAGLYSVEKKKLIMPLQYSAFGFNFSSNFIYAHSKTSNENGIGLFDYDGKEIIPCKYKEIYVVGKEVYCIYHQQRTTISVDDAKYEDFADIFDFNGNLLRSDACEINDLKNMAELKEHRTY